MEAPSRPIDAADSVTAILSDWARTAPQLDTSATGIIVRMGRIRAQLDASLAAVYAEHGITAADFAALSILRRAGEVPLSGLADGLYLSAGTITPRARRLQEAGLVELRADPADARVRLVRLTKRGRRTFDAVAPEHLAVQRDSLRSLSAQEAEHLEALLARVLADLEGR